MADKAINPVNAVNPTTATQPVGAINNPAPSEFCVKCGRRLEKDEIALTKKLINRGAENFWCLGCLARHFEVSEEVLKAKIIEFREMGCTLFE